MPQPTAPGQVAIAHADLDAFFAAVEQRDDPSLRGRPVIVGGLGPRGVVATASYEARRFGVHSAMAMARARQLCPTGVYLGPDFARYRSAAAAVFAIYRALTPLVEPLSLDEAFLDLRHARQWDRLGAGRLGAGLRARVREEVGLAVSVGLASTKLLAKLASEDAKPDGLLVLDPADELAWLRAKSVGRLWGVGSATESKLAQLGVASVSDLASVAPATLQRRLGRVLGARLAELAQNRDRRVVVPGREPKSLGAEVTFDWDVFELTELEECLQGLCDRVTERLHEGGVRARTLTLKMRFADWRTITRSNTLAQATDDALDVATCARRLVRESFSGSGVRLLGVSASGLVREIQQAFDLFATSAGELTDASRTRYQEGLFPGAIVLHGVFGQGVVLDAGDDWVCVRFDDGHAHELDPTRAGLRSSGGRLVGAARPRP